MKKFLNVIFLFVMLIIPFNVNAASITNTQIQGKTSVTTGEKFSLSFVVSYSGVQKGTIDTLGVGGVVIELKFDDSVFSIVGASSSDFNTEIGKENGNYYIISTIGVNDPFKNKCVDGVLFCADYLSTLTFYVKDTNKTSSTIQIGETNVILFKVGSDYDEDEAITISSSSGKSHAMTITNNGSNNSSEPQSIVSNSSPSNIVSKAESKVSKIKTTAPTTKNTTTTKTNTTNSNTYLKSLEIKDHKIDFNKDKLEYKIYVDDKTNKLDIIAQPENDSSTVKIIGADDLKSNNYKVMIDVVSKDNNKKTYVINVQSSSGKLYSNDESDDNKPKFKITKKMINTAIIIGSGVLIIGGIFILISHKKNKKLDKMLNDFDKF